MLPFDFTIYDAPLVHQWPTFDEVLIGTVSPPSSSSSAHSLSPSVELDSLPTPSSLLAAIPIPPSRSPPRNKNPDHIPRPRNAFMLFRSAFSAAQKISANIERDNRHITRIIAHCWNNLPDAEKKVWRDKAAAEKAQHAERYPNYRFSPVGRANKPAKRKVRRNGVEDVKRCEKLAELVMAGKYGQELESAVKKFDDERHSAENPVDVFTSAEKHRTPCVDAPSDVPPFRSPLLPPTGPTKTASEQVPDKSFMPKPPPCVAIAHHEPQAFYSFTDASISDDLGSLLSFQYYQSNMHDGVPPPRSVSPLDPFQSIMTFGRCAEPEQTVPDYSLFSWNQSDIDIATSWTL